MDLVKNGLKMHTLQEELERVQQENIQLQEHCGVTDSLIGGLHM